MTPKGKQHPRESVDISVKPQACLCCNIYVTPSKHHALLCTALLITTEL